MISIVIPIYQQAEMTQECLNALYANTDNFELILVDNGSIPPFNATTNSSNVFCIRNETNLGFPVAVNQGINAAKGDVIVLLNNDCVCAQGWSERLLAHLDSYSIVGPCTNFSAGLQRVTIPVYQDEQEFNIQAEKWAVAHKGESVEVNWIIGFCMAFRKSLWEEIGPFDQSLWPCSGEEIIFCMEARKRGLKVGICRDTYLHHHGSCTFGDLEKSGQLVYMDICNRNDKHIAELYGKDWNHQSVERSE